MEFRKLLEVSKPDRLIHLLFLLCGNLGLRVSEALALRYEDVDVENKLVRVQTAKQRKEGVVDELPVHERIVGLVTAERKRKGSQVGDHIFSFCKRTAQKAFDRYATKAGVKVLASKGRKGRGIHSLRHFRGLQLCEKNTDLVVVMKLLRHRNPMSTSKYLHTTLQRGAADGIQPVE